MLNKFIHVAYKKKSTWDTTQKLFSRNPFLNLLELVITMISIFDLGGREKVKVLGSLPFYYMFLTPFSRLIFPSLTGLEKSLISILIKFDIGYVRISNELVLKHLKKLYLEQIEKSTKFSKSEWKYIARLAFQLDKDGLFIINALKNNCCKNLGSISAAEIWEATNVCSGVFHMNGFYKSGENIEIEGKMLADKVSARLPGHYLENVYFSAIGHISLLDYLFKGKILGKFGTYKDQLVYNESVISNQAFAQLFLPICDDLNIEVLRNHQTDAFEGDLETFIKPGGEYMTARRNYSDIQMNWESDAREPLIRLTAEIRTTGRKILEDAGLPDDAWFVGLHIRSANDLLRIGRNADFENYIEAIGEISKQGGWILRTGTEKPQNTLDLPKYIDTRILEIPKPKRDILHTYIWACSKFFIGNLSGGTNPPGAFGVPTLWTDIHPISGFRPPSRKDLMLPKTVNNLKTNLKLSLKECLSDEHRNSQSENPFKLLMNGYKLESSSSSDLRVAVAEMFIKLSSERNSLSKDAERVDNLYSKVDLAYGAEICESFLKRNQAFLK